MLTIGDPFTPSGIRASGWDIWNGGTVNAIILRAQIDTIEKLLRKRGTIQGRHFLAAIDGITKVRSVRTRASAI